MKIESLHLPALLALGLIGSALPVLARAQETGDGGAARLMRVFPPTEGESAGGVLSPQDAELWRTRILDPDLDARERHFDQVVEMARRDDDLRNLLETWRDDLRDPELAWTARLALREVGAGSADPFAWLGAGAQGVRPLNVDRLFGVGPGAADVQRRLEEIRRSLRAGPGWLQHDWNRPVVPPDATTRSSSTSMRFESGPDGTRMVITEIVDGEEVQKEYEADSIEELLEAHPELADHLQVETEPLGEFGEWFSPGPGGNAWMFQWNPNESRDVRFSDGMRTDILGVYLRSLTDEDAERYGIGATDGLYIERTMPGSIASTLGLKRGHVLLRINDRPLLSKDVIYDVLCERPEDGDVRVEIVDSWGQHRTLTWRPREDREPAPEPPDPEPSIEEGARDF